MSADNIFIGQKAGGVESAPKLDPISKVILMVDNDSYFEAGTGDTVLEVTCPYGSQEMANNILSALSSYQYQPVQATDAFIDPAAELGDAMTVGGLYSVIANMDTTFDQLLTSDVGAPGQEEIESEYPYLSQQTAEANRRLAETRSLISKTAEEITLQVENLTTEMGQTLRVAADGVTITNAQGDTLTIDGGQIDASKINAAEIQAENLNLTGVITFNDLNSSTQSQITSAQTTASNAQITANNAQLTASSVSNTVGAWTYPGTTQINGTAIMTGTVTASTLRGGIIQLLNGVGGIAGTLNLSSATSAGYAVELNSNAAMRIQASSGNLYLQGGGGAFVTIGTQVYCGDNLAPSGDGYYSCGTAGYRWSDVYAQNSTIQTSDVNDKTDVEALPEKYLTMMDNITPLRYKLIDGQSGRYHVGFVAQEVESAMAAAGVDSMEFGGFVKDKDDQGNDIYMLRYGEFIAILWAKIRALEAIVNGNRA